MTAAESDLAASFDVAKVNKNGKAHIVLVLGAVGQTVCGLSVPKGRRRIIRSEKLCVQCKKGADASIVKRAKTRITEKMEKGER